jgi:hypothetical protein
MVDWCGGCHRRTAISTKGICEPHDQVVVLEDSPDNLNVGTAVHAFVTRDTSLVNQVSVAACRAHDSTIPT